MFTNNSKGMKEGNSAPQEKSSTMVRKKFTPSKEEVVQGFQTSTWIRLKHSFMEIELVEKNKWVCFTKGKITHKHLFEK